MLDWQNLPLVRLDKFNCLLGELIFMLRLSRRYSRSAYIPDIPICSFAKTGRRNG